MYYTHIDSPIGSLLLTSEKSALRGLHFSTGSKARGADPQWERYDEPFRRAKKQIGEYFAGKRKVFELDLDPSRIQLKSHSTRSRYDLL